MHSHSSLSLSCQLGIVDGVVTEDSDAFLFGARTVYKNIFSDKKFVEVSIICLPIYLCCIYLSMLHLSIYQSTVHLV